MFLCTMSVVAGSAQHSKVQTVLVSRMAELFLPWYSLGLVVAPPVCVL